MEKAAAQTRWASGDLRPTTDPQVAIELPEPKQSIGNRIKRGSLLESSLYGLIWVSPLHVNYRLKLPLAFHPGMPCNQRCATRNRVPSVEGVGFSR